MSQLSFFSAESEAPAVSDLAGLLAGQGQLVTSGSAARISVVVEELWRAQEIASMMESAGLTAEITRSEEGRPLVRTAATAELAAMAADWTKGAVKCVPSDWLPSLRALRAWTVASGRTEADRYLLGLDPHAPETYPLLAGALMQIGIAPTMVGVRGMSPALRISGKRRLSRLVENIGQAPCAEAQDQWPKV
ncbi:MAG: hypothetical protein ACRCSF_04300 [Mycobacteriaceae bacterium]